MVDKSLCTSSQPVINWLVKIEYYSYPTTTNVLSINILESEFRKTDNFWDTEDMNMGEMNYMVVKVGKEGLGGIMQTPSQAD